MNTSGCPTDLSDGCRQRVAPLLTGGEGEPAWPEHHERARLLRRPGLHGKTRLDRGRAEPLAPLALRQDDAVRRMFEDEVNPTDDEIRRWAYSGTDEPYEDFDIIVADPEHLAALVSLVADSNCPKRQYLLGSLYCTIGHSDLADPRIRSAIQLGLGSNDPWVANWSTRALPLLDAPNTRIRGDWCGWQGLRQDP